MSDPVQLEGLSPADPLGRYIASRSRADKAATRGIIATDIFLEKVERSSLSVDRLDHAPDSEMAEIARENVAARGKEFCGWAVVPVQQAAEGGRTVEPMPLLDNPYHATIDLNLPELNPPKNTERKDAAKQHAQSLAMYAVYRPPPQV